ncbi:MAG: exodeoxyribonuclease III [Leptolyngbyaceae bacterium]|nr:exodeoxyribonuclease III [Leptolyngbyaceae bacterium]
MKIATWNVNSVRTRLEHITDWLTANPVEVLCLQETKVMDDRFPRDAFESLGYHLYVSGQKAYNGVAIATRPPLESVSHGFGAVLGSDQVGDLDAQKRVITGMVEDIRIVNLYVPNGSSIGSDKYAYKLRWFGVLKQYLQALLAESPNLLVCGDFNVAPADQDIYNPEGKETHIMASPQERAALQENVLELGLADAFRKFTEGGGYFSWWDYRAGSFQHNRGWRIDHHYLSPPLYERAIGCAIDIQPREREKPSDHTPVVVELA